MKSYPALRTWLSWFLALHVVDMLLAPERLRCA